MRGCHAQSSARDDVRADQFGRSRANVEAHVVQNKIFPVDDSLSSQSVAAPSKISLRGTDVRDGAEPLDFPFDLQYAPSTIFSERTGLIT